MLRIFIAEQVPSRNKGEATLMYGIRQTIQESCGGEIFFYLCSSDQHTDQQAYGPNVKVLDHPGLIPMEYGFSKKRRLLGFISSLGKHALFYFIWLILRKNARKVFSGELWDAYLQTDVILIGHDNSFSKYHLMLIWFGKLIHKPVVVYGTTIMPKILNTGFFRKLGGHYLNKTDLITTREPITYNFLKEIGVRHSLLFCTADKAFLLEPAPKMEVDGLMTRLGLLEANGPLVGVMLVKGSNVFKAAFGEKYPDPVERYAKHVEVMAATLDALTDKIGCTFVFVPHSIGPHDEADDRLVHKDVVKAMKHANHAILVEEDLSAAELKGLMGRFHMTVSERTHGGIASATMHVPTLWVTHPGDSRTYGIVGKTLGLDDCLYDIRKLDQETLLGKLLWLWETREQLGKKLEVNTEKAKELTRMNGTYFKQLVVDKLPR